MDQFGAFLRQYRAEMCGIALSLDSLLKIWHNAANSAG